MSGLYVHYGCGFCAPHDWLNYDASPTLRFERLPVLGALYTKNQRRFPENVRYGDIIKGLPVPPGSCAAIYCSHMLDYVAYEDCKIALGNTKRMLRPGGIFRLVVQDCSYFMHEYIKASDPHAAIKFMDDTGWGRRSRPSKLFPLLKELWGHGYRLWMWDFESLASELSQGGFHSIRRAAFCDSVEPRFASVEEEAQWTRGIGIECRA